MEWTSQQDAALRSVARWIERPVKPFFYMAGYAGTGKTTLAKHLAGGVAGTVLFAAYTGKAAHVMRQKGCEGATTIHSLIYLPRAQCAARLRELEEQLANHHQGKKLLDRDQLYLIEKAVNEEKVKLGRPSFSLNESSPVLNASLLVLDECSMLDERIGSDLLTFGVPILVLGDPAQLPPVRGSGYFTSTEPDILLTDVQRQARDNPIIDMATRVRKGEPLPYGDYGTSKVTAKVEATEALAADQIIVGRNATRHQYNKRMRVLLGREALVEPQDKVICLRNNHEVGLLNGSIWKVEAVADTEDDDTIGMSIKDEDNGELFVCAHRDSFGTEPTSGSWFDRQHREEFCHGYAITCHKSQGSQFKDVLVVDESDAFGQGRNNWMYTALTRASDRVTVLRR